jgi:C-terminal processing protease CtpA/Prc/Tol biopolymer transport system component
MWAPDGRHLYTVSQESGTFNLWRRNLETGAKDQLTSFDDDGVAFPTISADGSTIVFRRMFDLHRYRPDVDTVPKKIDITYVGDATIDPILRETLDRATEVAFTDDAREIAFIAGGDLWVMDTELREPLRITETPEEERNPVFSPDFQSIVFVSDAGGQCDLWRAQRSDDDRYWWQQESFRLDRLTDDPAPEQEPRFTPDGKITFLKLRGDLWMIDADGKNPKKLLSSWNEPEYDFSPDGEWIVYAVSDNDFNRDVWLRRLDGSGEPFNLSAHPDNEGAPTWSPDGKMIAFSGRRFDTETDIFYVWLTKGDDETTSRDRTLEKALKKMKGRKGAPEPKGKEPKAAPAKPDEPKKEPAAEPPAATPPAPADPVSGVWDATIKGPDPIPAEGITATLELALGEEGGVTGTLEIAGEAKIPIQQGLWDAAASRLSFSVNSPMGLAEVAGAVANGTFQGTWNIAGAMGGEFTATRRAAEKAASPPKEPAPKAPSKEPRKDGSDDKKKEDDKAEKKDEEKKVEVVIDFDGIRDRIQRISIPNSPDRALFWSPDSKKLAMAANVGGRSGLYTVEFPDKLTPKLLTATVGSNGRWLEDGNQIVWLQGGQPAAVSAAGKATVYGFSARGDTDLRARHLAAFDLSWRTMRDRWYDERLGNTNWDAVGRKYREMAAECVSVEELAVVVNLMLGELNGSHLGFYPSRGRAARSSDGSREWREITVHLGVRFDEGYKGPGLRIRDVIDGTPAALEKSRLEAGDVILSIDGTTVDPSLDLAKVLTGPLDRDIELVVRAADGEERTVTLRPTTYGTVRARLYDAWVEHNREAVEKASDGKLGYLHIQGMNWPSFQRFEEELYEVGHGKDGLVIDVRENGGGFTTDHLLTALTQPVHAITVPRGGGPGYPHDRMVYATWHKPIIVLCNQNSFSNAEIFSHAVKTLGRGKVVGVRTAGGVISTGGTSIMGLGFLRLPFRGWFVASTGEDMELNGCEPHFSLWPEPGEMPAGKDRQLDKAIEVLLEDVEAWKARPRPALIKATERQEIE